MPRRVALFGIVALAVTAAVAGATAALLYGRRGGPPTTGTRVDRPVPAIPLIDRYGHRRTLADFRGKVVVLAPFLTLCHEVCPLTTGALERMRAALDHAGFGSDVALVEVSVDPWRDTPARLAAFARLTGAHLTLLTGTRPNLVRFWRFFGVAFLRTSEGTPADADWWTGRPLGFDVEHTDGLFLLDQRGHERVVSIGMPAPSALPRRLRRLLNDAGRRDLAHPEAPWTVQEALKNIGYLLGRRIPLPHVA